MAETPDPTELVEIRPKTEPDTAPGRVTRAAFDAYWAGQGFIIVDADDTTAAPAKPVAPKSGDAR